MSEVKTEPVEATLFEDIDQVKGKAGAFEYFKAGDRFPAGMIYCCPCGCGATGALNFRPHPSPSWEWNGNREKPTLTPSVHHVGHWHGFLTDGVWRSC
ncbi:MULTISPECIES: DUF6527 family protein [unclassified Mesorhizobium]|uniref:DUF6527 family protein n=1 Tax=unclassified Mesorhizobium TaxID=325217 RepID=UPI00112711CB|nr:MULTISPECIES: DUF6527 family protein [unclassified Mesorhizobium]TPK42325.1 hypothetical protein FJ550_30285 [Mesorhizobium sp. B2-5-2]TPL44480.1 hypothetical protein FJ961_03855 [Mesorhizobium sp. B2-4-5]TPM68667.1 hypothetical protein FJ968_29660 [Mesorhizobium sp. B2-1-6]TPN71773.1 hypothetical protein FJ985_30790 [Mesorhizobium sp. B1-1-2]